MCGIEDNAMNRQSVCSKNTWAAYAVVNTCTFYAKFVASRKNIYGTYDIIDEEVVRNAGNTYIPPSQHSEFVIIM